MTIKKCVLIIFVFVIFLFVGISVLKKEDLLKHGKTVLFELAPIDPRSIMQGDYMALDYLITRGVAIEEIPSRGYIVFKSTGINVAKRIRFQKDLKPLSEGERVIKYFTHKRDISIGSESFFFQEGDAELYSKAKYGGIKVAKNGESILFGLFDKNRVELKR